MKQDEARWSAVAHDARLDMLDMSDLKRGANNLVLYFLELVVHASKRELKVEVPLFSHARSMHRSP